MSCEREFLTRRAVRPWHSCPQSCGAPLLEVLKDELNGALGFYESMANCIIFQVLSKSNHFLV